MDDYYFDWLIRVGLYDQAAIQFGVEDLTFQYGFHSLHVRDYTVNLTLYSWQRAMNYQTRFKVVWK